MDSVGVHPANRTTLQSRKIPDYPTKVSNLRFCKNA